MAILSQLIDGQYGNDEKEEVGIGGFILLARVRDRFSRTASVPTVFLEDGSHVNDHIIRDPLTLSIEGSVSDVHLRPSPIVAEFQAAQAQVGNITQYLPGRTQSQASKVSALINDFSNAIAKVNQALDSADRVAGFFGLVDTTAKSNIERFIDTMESIYESGALINIDMPFRTYERMAITSLEVTRDNESRALSFNIDAQQFRFADTVFVEAGPAPNPAANTDGQTDGETDKGVQEGEVVDSAATNIKQTLQNLFSPPGGG